MGIVDPSASGQHWENCGSFALLRMTAWKQLELLEVELGGSQFGEEALVGLKGT